MRSSLLFDYLLGGAGAIAIGRQLNIEIITLSVLFSKHYVVNGSHIGTSDFDVTILIGVYYTSIVIVEKDVVEHCNIDSSNLAVTVHVARNHFWW